MKNLINRTIKSIKKFIQKREQLRAKKHELLLIEHELDCIEMYFRCSSSSKEDIYHLHAYELYRKRWRKIFQELEEISKGGKNNEE